MKIVYFAWFREKVGCGEENASPPTKVATVADLIEWMKGRGDGYADAFSDTNVIRAAVNQEYVTLDHAVEDGDEVAFFPPVTGG